MAMNIDAAVNISADVSGQQAVDKLTESLKRTGAQGEQSAKQTAAAMRMVPAQLTDIATQLAGGQSPFLIMMQQGGQLRDMFGSVTGALSGVAKTVVGMITPFTAVAAVAAAFGYAAFEGAQQSSELNKQLLLTGGAAGYTAGQIEQMASTLRDTQGIAAGAARDLMTGLAASGQFVGKNLNDAAAAAARLQKLSGQSSDEIVKDFSKMSSGVAAWAAEHNRQFNYLSVAQFKHIKQLEDMGDKEGAMKANVEALNKALEDRKKDVGLLESAWSALGKAASGAWDAMLNIGREETLESKLKNLRDKIGEFQRAGGARKGLFGEIFADENGSQELAGQQIAVLQEQARMLQQAVDKSQTEAAEKARKAAEVREKIEQIQSGKLAALENANAALRLERLKGESADRIALLEQEGQRVENQQRAGLITEEEYSNERLRIAKAILNERMKLAEQEMAVENSKPVNSPAEGVQRQSRMQALRNELAKLNAEATMAGLKADGDRAAYLRQMGDEVQKFSRTQQARIDQIRSEADAVGMSSLEYRKHTEALRIDKEAADAAAGKAPEWVAAIKAEAEAKKEATMAALDYADAKSRSFDTGVKSAMKDYVENVANAANSAKTLFSNAFKGMEDALVNFVKTGKMDFASLADSIISDLIRIAIQQQITGPIAKAMQGANFASMFGFANGGIMTPSGALPLNTYANGGIANRPQMALFGEGRTPEAFVPLPDGRHIPVAMQGGGGGSNVVVNVVNNASGTKATAQERQDSNGQRVIDVMIEQVKASIAADISRGVGTVTSALERTYGANRTAGAY